MSKRRHSKPKGGTPPIEFRTALEARFSSFFDLVATENRDWTVKGFIDIYKNIYTISVDTKVISKIIELMIFPVILDFANQHKMDIVLALHQNHYPDITFIDRSTKQHIALDIKSTYRTDQDRVNGMTLGAFTGYFRNRSSSKNITFPYETYDKHFILGIIYSRTVADEDNLNEGKTYSIENLHEIPSVVGDFEFFVQEKWKIASDRPGSGNTKNIGSSTSIQELKHGSGMFTKHANGEEMFNDYWQYYLTKDMAKAVDSVPPYRNLKSYLTYKQKGVK